MFSSHTLSHKCYLDNKEYFDTSLISLLEKQQVRIKKLKGEQSQRSASLYTKNATIKILRFKNKDLHIYNSNLKNALKDTKEDADELVKKINREIHQINHRIEDELQKSYTDNNQLYDENQKLKEELERLKKQNNKLEKMVHKDSSNSSLPPSRDIFKKPTNMREPTSKHRGGQPGHVAHHSMLCPKPHTIINKTVRDAPRGASPVFNDDHTVSYYVTQEIDAKFITKITETRYFISEEGETLTEETMRAYKINKVTYSNSFKSTVLYLNSKGTIALHRLCVMLNELSANEIHLSPSTVTSWSLEFYKKSQNVRATLLREAIDSNVLHVDETGWKVNGKMAWVHVLCTKDIAYFTCTKKRVDKEKGPLKLMEDYKGNLIHDHFKAYYQLTNSTHGECNAHIVRYLKAGVDFDTNIGCAKLIVLLKKMNTHKKELLKRGSIPWRSRSIKNMKKSI